MKLRLGLFLAIALILMIAVPVKQVYAHEPRVVMMGGNATNWLVGWSAEPTYTQVLNHVQLFATCCNGSSTPVPVNGLDTALQVQVATGGQSVTLGLERSDDDPTLYQAAITPTVPGTYTFTFFGTVNGTAVSQVFDCSKGLFQCVDPLSDSEFPVKQPTPTDLQSSINDSSTKISSLQTQVGTLTIIAAAGVVVGIIGVAMAILVPMRRKP